MILIFRITNIHFFTGRPKNQRFFPAQNSTVLICKDMIKNYSDHSHAPWLIFLLSSIVAVSPLAIDLYLPAMPGMIVYFNSSLTQVQLTMSAYLAGFAAFHLFCGPLADRFGRRPVIISGLIVFAISSYACARAETIEELVMLRFIQGLGACCGPTLGRAVVRDLYGPEHAVKALAYMAMIMGTAPAVAPAIGGFMLLLWPWTSMFYALGIYGLGCAILVYVALPESLPVKQSLHPVGIARNYWQLVCNRRYLMFIHIAALMFSGTLLFIAGASFVLIDMMGVKPEHFGFLFFFIVAGYMAGNFYCVRLNKNNSSEHTMKLGAQIALYSGIVMLILSSVISHPMAIIAPMAIYNIGVGLVLPHATASALKPFSHMAGTASSLQGFIQMGLASLLAALVGLLLIDSPVPMTALVASVAMLALLLIHKLPPESESNPIK
jgi:DHA1 family bicyclomycin/chloramphenicol resistance-like MFS transporter